MISGARLVVLHVLAVLLCLAVVKAHRELHYEESRGMPNAAAKLWRTFEASINQDEDCSVRKKAKTSILSQSQCAFSRTPSVLKGRNAAARLVVLKRKNVAAPLAATKGKNALAATALAAAPSSTQSDQLCSSRQTLGFHNIYAR